MPLLTVDLLLDHELRLLHLGRLHQPRGAQTQVLVSNAPSDSWYPPTFEWSAVKHSKHRHGGGVAMCGMCTILKNRKETGPIKTLLMTHTLIWYEDTLLHPTCPKRRVNTHHSDLNLTAIIPQPFITSMCGFHNCIPRERLQSLATAFCC